MTDHNTFRDVHFYDYKWEHEFRITTKYSISHKVHLYNWLIPLSNEWGTSNGRLGLRLVMGDTQKPPNCDQANNVYADDILCELLCVAQTLNLVQQKELVVFLDEQLADMIITNGCCPQGRAQRLIQVYQAFRSTHEDEEFHAKTLREANKRT